MESLFTIYDTIEIIGGFIGGASICIGIIIVVVTGLLNHQSLIQIVGENDNTLILIAVCGMGFTMVTIAVSKLMQMSKILDKYNEVS